MSDMYPAGYDPWSVVQQAMAYQQPGTPPSFPQMTPAQQYYGPTHAALSRMLQQALMNQAMNTGLLSPATPQSMGLLSNAMPQSAAMEMPVSGGSLLQQGQYYRLDPNFWSKTPDALTSSSSNSAPVVTPTPVPAAYIGTMGPNGLI